MRAQPPNARQTMRLPWIAATLFSGALLSFAALAADGGTDAGSVADAAPDSDATFAMSGTAEGCSCRAAGTLRGASTALSIILP
jgi:hypothetical protein